MNNKQHLSFAYGLRNFTCCVSLLIEFTMLSCSIIAYPVSGGQIAEVAKNPYGFIAQTHSKILSFVPKFENALTNQNGLSILELTHETFRVAVSNQLVEAKKLMDLTTNNDFCINYNPFSFELQAHIEDELGDLGTLACLTVSALPAEIQTGRGSVSPFYPLQFLIFLPKKGEPKVLEGPKVSVIEDGQAFVYQEHIRQLSQALRTRRPSEYFITMDSPYPSDNPMVWKISRNFEELIKSGNSTLLPEGVIWRPDSIALQRKYRKLVSSFKGKRFIIIPSLDSNLTMSSEKGCVYYTLMFREHMEKCGSFAFIRLGLVDGQEVFLLDCDMSSR